MKEKIALIHLKDCEVPLLYEITALRHSNTFLNPLSSIHSTNTY